MAAWPRPRPSPASSRGWKTRIDYEAVDSQPVDLVFMLLAPENAGADHLKALARVSRLLRDKAVCEKLRAAKSAEALYAILTGDKNGAGTPPPEALVFHVVSSSRHRSCTSCTRRSTLLLTPRNTARLI